jgi:hypothetical protein
MSFYEWLGEPEAVDIEFPDLHVNSYWMVEGQAVESWNERIVGTFNGSRPPTFHFGIASNSWPIFSRRFQHFMDVVAPRSVQYLPFKLQCHNRADQIDAYSIGQLLTLIDCIDKTRTKVRTTWNPVNRFGDFDTFWPIDVALRSELIGDASLFRVKGNCGSIIIRADLKSAIEDAGFGRQRFAPITVV